MAAAATALIPDVTRHEKQSRMSVIAPPVRAVGRGLPEPLIAFGLAARPVVALGFTRFAYALLLPAMREQLSWNFAAAGAGSERRGDHRRPARTPRACRSRLVLIGMDSRLLGIPGPSFEEK